MSFYRSLKLESWLEALVQASHPNLYYIITTLNAPFKNVLVQILQEGKKLSRLQNTHIWDWPTSSLNHRLYKRRSEHFFFKVCYDYGCILKNSIEIQQSQHIHMHKARHKKIAESLKKTWDGEIEWEWDLQNLLR